MHERIDIVYALEVTAIFVRVAQSEIPDGVCQSTRSIMIGRISSIDLRSVSVRKRGDRTAAQRVLPRMRESCPVW